MIAPFLHLVFTVFLVGYVLYWAIMVVSLRRTFDPSETDRLLGIANRARWPHVGVPWRLRLPLPLMAWGFLGILLITGLVLAAGHGFDMVLGLKVALVILFAVIHLGLTRRPAPPLVMVNFALALIIVVLSGLLIRA